MGAVKELITEKAEKIAHYIESLSLFELKWLLDEVHETVLYGGFDDMDEDWWEAADSFDVGWMCATHGINLDDAHIESVVNEEWLEVNKIVYRRSSMHGGWFYQIFEFSTPELASAFFSETDFMKQLEMRKELKKQGLLTIEHTEREED